MATNRKSRLEERLGKGALMLRIVDSTANEYTYNVIERVTQRELYLHTARFQDNRENSESLEEYLEQRGVTVTTWYDSNGFTEENPVNFYDIEYDFDTGITEATELSFIRQAELLINRAEYSQTYFNADDRNLIVNYAYKLGNMEDTQRLIDEMIDAIESPDLRSIQYVKDMAQIEIDDLPDAMVGISDMYDFGFRSKSILPITKERALTMHEYDAELMLLNSDGTRAMVQSVEDIQNHDGIFGITKREWKQMREMPEPEGDLSYVVEAMHPLTREHALEFYDLGYDIYYPMENNTMQPVQRRTEIENGLYFQMPLIDWEQSKERLIMEGSVSRYGIYQLRDTEQARDYRFMGLDFVERHGYHVEKSDYEMVYSGLLGEQDSLDSLYERFNLQRPSDFTGHSLSVSDVVVLQRNGIVTANYVDSFGFQELEDFLEVERPLVQQIEGQDEIAFHIGDRYLTVQEVEDGYDYNIYDETYKLLDGGVYDNPDISMWEATQELFCDLQEPSWNQTTGEVYRTIMQGNVTHKDKPQVIDYDDFIELVEEVNRIHAPLTPTSNMHTPEKTLNGQNRSEIEETVLALAQVELIEMDSDAELIAARVYGSRNRELLTRPDSDLDVVLYYHGDIAEDTLFNALNQYGMSIGGMKLDINPIKAEKTGTLEAFLKRSDLYLYDKEQELLRSQEYKPLAKVEELEEANYNMIDNIINNEKPKAKLDYYVAECDEFHHMGEYLEGLTLEEAVSAYKKILDDPSRSYMGNAMGFVLHDEDEMIFSEMAYPVVQGKSVHGDNINDVQVFALHPLVREAVEKLHQAFPEFPFYPPESLVEAMYPQRMDAEQLAVALDEIARDYDPYEWEDQRMDDEERIRFLKQDLIVGNTAVYVHYLKNIVEDGGELASQAQALLKRLESANIRIEPDMIPQVKILYSQYEGIPDDRFYPIDEFNQKIKDLDTAIISGAEKANEGIEPTYRIHYQIYYYQDSKIQNLDGNIDVGNGCGSLLEYMEAQIEIKMNDEGWMKYQEGLREGKGTYQQELSDMQEKILPYLQSFCSIEERAPETSKIVESDVNDSKENVKSVGKEPVEKKLSIHERLAINKEKLEKKSDKDDKIKGLELA
ncbi:MAG: DUF4316 domain-containing protein [Clostridia bacterium]|nr:DUF4316 domain-containing protein [Clostridia bacterium]